jgi:TP901 family phage tail tape measure protein
MPFKAGTIIGEAVLDTGGWTRGMNTLAKGLTAVGIIAVAKVVADKFIELANAGDAYQKSLSNVATVVNTTQISLSDLSSSVLHMSPALGTATQLMDAMYQTFSSGASSLGEAMNITENAAKFSKAALTDATKSVDVLTTAINAYGKDVITAEQASDIFFQTVKLGKLTGEELAATIGQSIPLFASSGIKLEELAAGLAAMTQQGISAHQSTTQLNSIINAFLKPSEDMIKLLKQQGYESGAALLKTEGLAGALKILETATGGDAAKLAKLIPELNGMKGAMALTGRGGDIFTASLDAMANSAGSTEVAFNKQRKVVETAKASWANLETVIGNIATYFSDSLVTSSGTVAQNIQTFVESGQGMDFFAESAGIVAGSFDVLGTVLKMIGNEVMPSVNSLTKTFTTTMDNIGQKTGVTFSATKLLAGGLQLVVATFVVTAKVIEKTIDWLGATVAAIGASSKAFDTFFNFIAGKKSWKDVQDSLATAATSFKDLGTSSIDYFVDIGKTVADVTAGFGKGVDEKATVIETTFKTSSEKTSNAIKHDWQSVWTGAAHQAQVAADEMADSNEEVTDSTDKETKKSKNIWKDYWDDLWKDSKVTTKGIIDNAKDVISSISDMASNLTNLVFGNEQAILDNQVAAIDQSIKKIETDLTAATSALDASTTAQTKSIDDETQALLESLGIAEETKTESLQRQIDEAIASGDEETAASLQAQLQRENILADAEARKTKLKEDAETQRTALETAAAAETERLEAEKLQKKNDLAKKQFEAQKVNDISKAWIDAASATLGWWAAAPSLGPIAGPIFAGVMTAAMVGYAAAQTAIISQKQFVPEYAEGGTASGISRINEQGGEIVNLPDGTIVIPSDISQMITDSVGSGGSQINLSFDGARIDQGVDIELMAKKISRILWKELRLA